MAVSSNVQSYVKIMKKLTNTYKLYEDSVDTIVEVWKPMLNSSDSLKKTFNLLIMTEFDENIWSDRNIKIVIEEIIQHSECLLMHKDKLTEIIKINECLEHIRQSYNKQDSNAKPKKENKIIESEINNPNSTICTCPKCSKPTIAKKRKSKTRPEYAPIKSHKKEKSVMVNGKNLNDLETDELINYINGESNNNRQASAKPKPKSKKKPKEAAKPTGEPLNLRDSISEHSVVSNNSISLSDTTKASTSVISVAEVIPDLEKDLNETEFNDIKKRFSYNHESVNSKESINRSGVRPKLRPNLTKEWIGNS
jgi:hypothetical protein